MRSTQSISASNRDSHGERSAAFPGRWRVSPLRHLIGQIQSGVSVNASDIPAALGEVAVLKTSSVYTGDFDASQTKPVLEGDLHRVACPVAADRLIVSRMNTPALVGMAGYSAFDVPNVFLPDRLWQVSFVGVDARFIHRWTQTSAYRDQVTVVTAGTSSSMHNLAQDDFKSFVLAIPPAEEQDAILRYLDRETAKIDVLIEKQEQLIEMLAERLDGAWSSSVNELIARFPSAPMRRVIDSIVDGPFGSSLTSAHYSDEGAGVVRLGNIGIDEFKLDDRAYVPVEYAQALSAHAVAPGDVVVAGLGDEKMPLGRAAIVPEFFGHGIVKADCYRVRPGVRVSAKYVAWILSSPQSRTQFRALSRGSTRQRLNTQVVRDVVIPVPTLEVQEALVSAFADTRSANGSLVAKACEMIVVLKERRQALISAAVTGKIDVRGLLS